MTKLEEKWCLTREMVGADHLSVIMPLYKLASTAAENLRFVASLFEQHEVNAELVPVDDGSQDGTDAILNELAKVPYKHIKICPVICAKIGRASCRERV